MHMQLYPVGFEEDRWFMWQHWRQSFGQSIQDYRTDQNQTMVLELDLDDHELFMQFIRGLQEYIRKELRLFKA